MSDGSTITGPCGHTGTFDAFTTTPIGGDLPAGSFQCPKCGRAWEIQRKGKAVVTPSGFVIPPDNVLVTTAPRL